jgi:hypothetical protein
MSVTSDLDFDFSFTFRYHIDGPTGAVLHHGDFRAKLWFLKSLGHNHFLQPYLYSSSDGLLHQTLECIYLDNACVFSPLGVPTKVSSSIQLGGPRAQVS